MLAGVPSRRRVIIDTSYLRGAPIRAFEALQSKGFDLSISDATLTECLAQAHTRDAWMVARIRKIRRYLDAVRPVVPHGELLRRVFTAGRRDAGPLLAQICAVFRRVLDEYTAPRDAVLNGDLLQERVEEFGATHVEAFQKALRLERIALPDRPIADVVRDEVATFCTNAGFSPMLQRRGDAYFKTFGLRAIRSVTQKVEQFRPAKPNDAEDLGLLTLIGLPALVSIKDGDVVRDLDASGSYQAAWARTFHELLHEPLPPFQSWGTIAEAHARRFKRRPWATLMADESALFKRLKD
jgi:hypothetical protein